MGRLLRIAGHDGKVRIVRLKSCIHASVPMMRLCHFVPRVRGLTLLGLGVVISGMRERGVMISQGSFVSNFILVNNRTRVLLLWCICFPRTLNVQFVCCTCSSHHWSSSCGTRPWLSGTLHEGAVAGRPGSHSETLGGRGGWPCHPPGQYEDGGRRASSASFCVDALNLCRDSAV